MSLRARLIIGVLLLVALAIGTVSTITFVALRSFLIAKVDTQLTAAPPNLVERHCRRPVSLAHPPPVPPRLLFLAELTAGGARTAACQSDVLSRPLALSDADIATLRKALGRPVELTDQPMPMRAQARPSPVGGIQVVALSLDEVDQTLRQLLVLELVVGALALVSAGLLGAWGVRWGLNPLARVTATARAVAEGVSTGRGGLQHRVPAGPSGTEVGQLAEAFNTMLTAVQTELAGRQDSEQRMRQFLADASHELRTPLTSLRGYAELIALREQRAGTAREPESADALRRMSHEGARMSRLVDDLLMLARSDHDGHRRDEPVALPALAADAVADLRAAHPDREITLVVADPTPSVCGDPDHLRQVLLNLLTNAAVHTRPGGPIRVSLGPVGGSMNGTVNGGVELVVADQGPGLTPRQAGHVFDRFWRADTARTRARGGSGLGLSIVDSVVSAHGGTIDFDTSPESGTVVTVRLPT
ncbi:MAG TPA: HAMP domain-containing sensor histidine kinase [Pseudonocardia sp.]